jgi:hypothetical protein
MRYVVVTILTVVSCSCCAALAEITPFVVENSTGAQYNAAVSGSLVLWGQSTFIKGKDLGTGDTFTIDQAGEPKTNGSTVVFRGTRNGVFHLYAMDIKSGREWIVGASATVQSTQSFGENIVTWLGLGFHAYDIRTDQDTVIPSPGGGSLGKADESGNIVVMDQTSGLAIYGYDLNDGRMFSIAQDNNRGLMTPAISGNIVVWKKVVSVSAEIWACDLSNNTTFPIDVGVWGHAWPDIDGRYVVWGDGRNGGPTSLIWGYDLLTGVEFQISQGPAIAKYPRVSGNLVVWESYDVGEVGRVMGAYIPEPASVGLLALGGALLAARRRR